MKRRAQLRGAFFHQLRQRARRRLRHRNRGRRLRLRNGGFSRRFDGRRCLLENDGVDDGGQVVGFSLELGGSMDDVDELASVGADVERDGVEEPREVGGGVGNGARELHEGGEGQHELRGLVGVAGDAVAPVAERQEHAALRGVECDRLSG